jgi:hypothetical protein
MHQLDFGLGILDFGLEENLGGQNRLFSGNPKSEI